MLVGLYRTFSGIFLTAALSLFLAGCAIPGHSTEQPFTPQPPFTTGFSSGLFTVVGFAGDEETVIDVAANLADQSKQICEDLQVTCDLSVQVELFPDQATFDRLGMNPEMQGFYAYSGEGRIQMVTPRQEIPGMTSDYAQRVAIAAHEFVHLVNDKINPDIPLWLDEGVAVAAAPHPAYEFVTSHQFPFELVPTLDKIENSYQSVPAADLFAFSLVDYIISEYDWQTLNDLIREPDSFERILGINRNSFEQGWIDYLNQNYHKE